MPKLNRKEAMVTFEAEEGADSMVFALPQRDLRVDIIVPSRSGAKRKLTFVNPGYRFCKAQWKYDGFGEPTEPEIVRDSPMLPTDPNRIYCHFHPLFEAVKSRSPLTEGEPERVNLCHYCLVALIHQGMQDQCSFHDLKAIPKRKESRKW